MNTSFDGYKQKVVRRKRKKKRSRSAPKLGKPSVDRASTSGAPVPAAPSQSKKEKKQKKERKAEQREANAEEKAEAAVSVQPQAAAEDVATNRTGAVLADSFDTLDINEQTKTLLRDDFGFTRMTEIQALTIPPLLAGKNILAEAKTGSGKTLAFLVPSLEILLRGAFKPHNGTAVLIITPTRELALQIFGVARDLMVGRTQTYGVVMGGTNRSAEADKLSKGVNLVISTPGRLLDHLRTTKGFIIRNLKALVIDEADRILQHGFEEEMHAILKLLPKDDRQTMLFSATQTKDVKQLARLSMKERPVFVTTKTRDTSATVAGLQQGYIVCPADLRFLLLFTFVKRNLHRKVMVFMSSCNAVKHFTDLFNYIDVPVLGIHGKQKQTKRTNTFFEFCNAQKGVLLCTDVAARGLDIPAVDWIIQFDPPDDTAEYIHRVGRTARAGSSGKALLFLMENELGYLKYLKQANVPLNEYSVPKEKLSNIGGQLEKLIQKNYYLHQSARSAYRSYLAAYTSHQHREVFNVHDMDLMKVAKSFGFTHPPKVELNIKPRSKSKKGGKKWKDGPNTRHDGRQWSK